MASSKYVLPNFKFYKPKKLKKLDKKVQEETDKREVRFAKNRYDRALDYLREDKDLRRNHYKAISYHLSQLKKDDKNLYDRFIIKANNFFKKEGRYYYNIKAILSSYYNEFTDNEIFNLLSLIVIKNNNWKEDLGLAKKLIERSKDSNLFFSKVIFHLKSCNSIKEIEVLKKKLAMKGNNRLLKKAIYNLLISQLDNGILRVDNHLYISFLENYLPLEDKKKVFQKVLLDNNNINNFDHISDELELWMDLIGETLGDPYGSNSAKWGGISKEAQDFFKRWKVHNNISYFFGEISGDQRRLDFWKKYSDYFYRVEYFEEYEKALLMESKDHLFIEFAGGGALYMYDKKHLNTQKVIEESYNNSKTYIVTGVLKDKILCKERLIHQSDWEFKFSGIFSRYGYKTSNKEA